jgi:ferredoxin
VSPQTQHTTHNPATPAADAEAAAAAAAEAEAEAAGGGGCDVRNRRAMALAGKVCRWRCVVACACQACRVVTTRRRAARVKKEDAASERNLKPLFSTPHAQFRLVCQFKGFVSCVHILLSFILTAQRNVLLMVYALKNTLTRSPPLPICLALPVIPPARASAPVDAL